MAVLLENFINHTMQVEEDEKKKMQAELRSRAEVLSNLKDTDTSMQPSGWVNAEGRGLAENERNQGVLFEMKKAVKSEAVGRGMVEYARKTREGYLR